MWQRQLEANQAEEQLRRVAKEGEGFLPTPPVSK
jgi:hypothetical protein